MSDYARAVYDLVEQNPGLYSIRLLARELGVTDGAIHTALIATEKAGLLLHEDDKGKLYASPPFGAPDTLTDKAGRNNKAVRRGI